MTPHARAYDTVIVPAREEGFQRVFIGEHRWYPIRLSAESRRVLRFIAAYRVAPISAVTHYAEIRGCTPFRAGTWVLDLGDPREVRPIRFIRDGVTPNVQTPRLATLEELLSTDVLNPLLKR